MKTSGTASAACASDKARSDLVKSDHELRGHIVYIYIQRSMWLKWIIDFPYILDTWSKIISKIAKQLQKSQDNYKKQKSFMTSNGIGGVINANRQVSKKMRYLTTNTAWQENYHFRQKLGRQLHDVPLIDFWWIDHVTELNLVDRSTIKMKQYEYTVTLQFYKGYRPFFGNSKLY